MHFKATLAVAAAVAAFLTPAANANVYGVQAGLVSIDSTTGAITPVPISGAIAVTYNGETTADPAGRRLFLLGTDGTPG